MKLKYLKNVDMINLNDCILLIFFLYIFSLFHKHYDKVVDVVSHGKQIHFMFVM